MTVWDGIVYVVDQDASIAQSVCGLLVPAGFNVAPFGTLQAFLQTVRPDTPACLLLDLDLAGRDGVELQNEVADTGAGLPIIFFSGLNQVPPALRALESEGVEILPKPVRAAELLRAVRRAIDRDRSSRLERAEVETLRRRYGFLTSGERNVMAGIVAGKLNKQIAAELGMTEVTVREQRGQLMAKMQAESLPRLVRMAARLGLPAARFRPRQGSRQGSR